MDHDINVKIHIAALVNLGGHGQWNWHQDHAAGPDWRIYWNREPGAFVKTSDGEIQLTPERVILMAPGTEYSTRATAPVHHFYAHFSVSEPFSRVRPGLFQLPYRDLCSMASELAENIDLRSDSWSYALKLQIYLLTAMSRLPAEALPPARAHDFRIAQALQLIESCPEISNPELADAVHMCVNSFLKLFRDEVGEPPQTYSRRKRLADAARHLHFSQASIDDIAHAAGFYDRYHFSRAFKREYRLAPAAYRKQSPAH